MHGDGAADVELDLMGEHQRNRSDGCGDGSADLWQLVAHQGFVDGAFHAGSDVCGQRRVNGRGKPCRRPDR